MKKNILISVIVLVLVVVAAFLVKNSMKVENKLAPGEIGVYVYFVKNKNGKEPTVAPVFRKVKVEEKLRTAYSLLLLLEGVNAQEAKEGYYSELPKTATLVSINENDKGYTLNFSKDLVEGGGSSSMQIRLDQIVKTVEANADKPIYINVEGKKITTFGGEGLELNQPIVPKNNNSKENKKSINFGKPSNLLAPSAK